MPKPKRKTMPKPKIDGVADLEEQAASNVAPIVADRTSPEKQFGLALQYASEDLGEDRDFMPTAVTQFGFAMQPTEDMLGKLERRKRLIRVGGRHRAKAAEATTSTEGAIVPQETRPKKRRWRLIDPNRQR